MSASEMTTVVSSDARRYTIVNLKQVNELPLRNVLQSFDKNGDGKIDISELQKIVYWHGLWKYASFGLCLIIMTLVWSTFGLTIWAINLTKDYSVTDGVLTGGGEVVKTSIASTHIPLSWASLLDRRHLDALESLSIDVTQSSGTFSAGVYHIKVASYLHANSTYLKLFGKDGSRVWVNSGTVVLHHPDAEEAVMVCGAAACNTLAVDVKPEYLQQLVQRSAALLVSSQDFELPATVDGVAINKAAGDNSTCQAMKYVFYTLNGTPIFGGAYNDITEIPDQEIWTAIDDETYTEIHAALSNDWQVNRFEALEVVVDHGEGVNLDMQDRFANVKKPAATAVQVPASANDPVPVTQAHQTWNVAANFGDAPKVELGLSKNIYFQGDASSEFAQQPATRDHELADSWNTYGHN